MVRRVWKRSSRESLRRRTEDFSSHSEGSDEAQASRPYVGVCSTGVSQG